MEKRTNRHWAACSTAVVNVAKAHVNTEAILRSRTLWQLVSSKNNPTVRKWVCWTVACYLSCTYCTFKYLNATAVATWTNKQCPSVNTRGVRLCMWYVNEDEVKRFWIDFAFNINSKTILQSFINVGIQNGAISAVHIYVIKYYTHTHIYLVH